MCTGKLLFVQHPLLAILIANRGDVRLAQERRPRVAVPELRLVARRIARLMGSVTMDQRPCWRSNRVRPVDSLLLRFIF